MSLSARGTIANAITFSSIRGRQYAKRKPVPSNPKSGLQVGIRSVFKFITQDWSNRSAAEQTAWTAQGTADNIHGLPAMVRSEVARARRNLGWRDDPDPGADTTPDAPTDGTAVAQPKTLVVGWTRPAGNQGNYCYALYMSTETGFTPDISNLVSVGPVDTVSVTLPNLVTGTEYYFRVRETNGDGDLGALLAEWNEAPE